MICNYDVIFTWVLWEIFNRTSAILVVIASDFLHTYNCCTDADFSIIVFMAVQRHPIPKDVLPSVSGARVCRGESPPLHPTHRAVAHHRRRCTACYMWLRRHFGLCSPQHQHCTESRVTPHCREMLDNFRANGVTFRKPAAGARQTPPLRVNSRAWGISMRACWATETATAS